MRFGLIRLSYKLLRFEVVAFGVLAIGLAAAALLHAARVDSARPPVECLVPGDGKAPDCDLAFLRWYLAQGDGLAMAPGLLPFVALAAGIFLGAPIVAREIERGNSRLAWSLAPSRLRWYLARMIPILVALVILTFVAGVVLDRHAAASSTESDLTRSFTQFGFRGILIAARATLIFAIAVAVGAFLGRTLPTVIVAAVLATAAITVGSQAHQRFLRTEAVVVAIDKATPGDLTIDQQFQLPNGLLVDYGYFEGSGPPWDEEGNPRFPIVALVIPGERYRFVEAREALALAGASLAGLVLAGAVLVRRRPD